MLNEIKFHDTDRFDSAMKRFLPRYEEYLIRPSGSRLQFYLREAGLSSPISAARVSDGTLRFLAILAVLQAPTPPPLLCLEEPELGMHPDAISLLAELLVEASTRMQIVVTTHSDALLSALNDHVDSVLVCENNGNGTTIEHLDADRLAFWLDKYKLGEIWRLGEIGGNP
jgi:predicted ATPase